MSKREVSLVDKLMGTLEGRRRFLQERAIVKVSEMIESTMEEQGLTRAALARKMGRTKGWVTQLLDGEQNMTVRTVADILAVLDREVSISSAPIEIGKRNILPIGSTRTTNEMAVWSSRPELKRVQFSQPKIVVYG